MPAEATQASTQRLCRAGEYLASEGLQQQLLGLSAQHLGSGSVPYSERLQLHPGSLVVPPSALLPDPTERAHFTLNHVYRITCFRCTEICFQVANEDGATAAGALHHARHGKLGLKSASSLEI